MNRLLFILIFLSALVALTQLKMPLSSEKQAPSLAWIDGGARR